MTKNRLPNLKPRNRDRIMTKHFTNFCLVLDRDSLGLFAWLCYRADSKNKIEWCPDEINAYRTYLNYLIEEYSSHDVKVSERVIRRVFKGLCDKGFVLGGEYVNPLFSYPVRRGGDYERIAKLWDSDDISAIINICKSWK